MVPADSDKVSRASPYSGYSSSAPICAYGACTSYGRPFNAVLLIFVVSFSKSYNPSSRTGLASFPFARRYLGNRFFFLFLRVLRCFSSPGYLLYTYGFSIGYIRITVCGLPHSDIHGSMDMCSSPWLIAACHVLLRLLVPRHPPCALSCLTCMSTAE